MTKLVILAHPEIKKIAVPVSASLEVDMLAEEFGLTVLKTRDSHLALMEAASNKQIKFIGGTRGGFIYNEFLHASDGMFSVGKLLECLALSKQRFGDLDRDTPHLHLVKRDVACSWNLKGQVMRLLMKDSEHFPRELIDGVRVFPRQGDRLTSVLLNPDRTRPVFHVNAESSDSAIALQLANEYVAKLHVWMNK